MNVLQLISSGMGYYGAERVVVTLSAALEERGVDTVVAAFRNTEKTIHLEVLDNAKMCGLKTEQIACHGRFDRNAVQTINRIVERYQIDVIHCHGIKPALYAFLTTRHNNVAIVSTCHLWAIECAEDWLIAALERCILHGADRVVAVSEHIIPQLHRFGLRADVIQNGIDLEQFHHPVLEFRRLMDWCDRLVIGSFGRLAPQKGLQYLLRAAPEVLRDNPNALFVFIGDGPERLPLETEARALGIWDAVCFLGVRQDIPNLLSAVDVVAMPSLDEGTPMALLEAMASGRAVVASRVGAIPQVIQERVNGVLVSPRDVSGLSTALRELLRDRDLRISLGQKARATVELRFSARSMAKQYLEVYGKTISNRSNSRHVA